MMAVLTKKTYWHRASGVTGVLYLVKRWNQVLNDGTKKKIGKDKDGPIEGDVERCVHAAWSNRGNSTGTF